MVKKGSIYRSYLNREGFRVFGFKEIFEVRVLLVFIECNRNRKYCVNFERSFRFRIQRVNYWSI